MPTKPIRLITLAPGHFHAALVQKRRRPSVNVRCHVYGPLNADTLAHVSRLASFNARADEPTAWELDLRTGPDWLERFLREQPGNTVVLSGRNGPKIDLMRAAIGCGLNVLADKPWVIDNAGFAKLEDAMHEATLREVLVVDMMTERHEMTNQLQRELIRDADIFGQWLAGSPERPALALESMHFLKKSVDGRPLIRPWWWFDPTVAGEAMADVGTHLADLALWFIAPEMPVDFRTDINLLDADRWPLLLSEEQFREVTGLAGYPPELDSRVVEGQLYYAGNNTVTFSLRGVHAKLTTSWEYEAPPGARDTHNAVAHGTKASIAIRQSPGERPEVWITPASETDQADIVRALQVRCAEWNGRFPGIAVEERGPVVRLEVPVALRTGHESHFAPVMDEFARYFHSPRTVPSWERTNAIAKYYITTQAVEMARMKRLGV